MPKAHPNPLLLPLFNPRLDIQHLRLLKFPGSSSSQPGWFAHLGKRTENIPNLSEHLDWEITSFSIWSHCGHGTLLRVAHLLPRILPYMLIHSHPVLFLVFRPVTECVTEQMYTISVVYEDGLLGIWKGQYNIMPLWSSVFQISDHWINIWLMLWAASGMQLRAVQRHEYLARVRGHRLAPKGLITREITSWKSFAIVHWMYWMVPRGCRGGNGFSLAQLEMWPRNVGCGWCPH